MDFEQRVQALEARNKKVEGNKQWGFCFQRYLYNLYDLNLMLSENSPSI